MRTGYKWLGFLRAVRNKRIHLALFASTAGHLQAQHARWGDLTKPRLIPRRMERNGESFSCAHRQNTVKWQSISWRIRCRSMVTRLHIATISSPLLLASFQQTLLLPLFFTFRRFVLFSLEIKEKKNILEKSPVLFFDARRYCYRNGYANNFFNSTKLLSIYANG